MSLEFQEAREFGYAFIPSYAKWCFIVKLDEYRQTMIQTSGQPQDVYWSGGSLIVEMDQGEVRRYYGLNTGDYNLVYL